MKKKTRKQNVIGVFTAELSEAYQAAIWHGIEDRASEMGLGLVCFLGSRIESPFIPERTANFVYDLAYEETLDGVIVISSAISTYLEYQDIRPYFEKRRTIPQVSIGYRIPGYSSITVDGRDGISKLLNHVLVQHKKRKFAFIFGPEGHDEAETRKEAVLSVLGKHRIKPSGELCINGTFEKDSGVRAVKELLARKKNFDVLVCFNDTMALGAMQELQNHGFRVPEDIIVTGFDNIEESQYSTPPLSTVNQPLYQVGVTAVDELLDLMNGKDPADHLLNCRMQIRESCGCEGKLFSESLENGEFPGTLDEEARQETEKLLDLLGNRKYKAFFDRFKLVLGKDLLKNRNPQRWYDSLAYMVQEMKSGDYSYGSDFSATVNRIFVLIGNTAARYEGSRRLEYSQRQDNARLVSISLAEAFDLPHMLERLKAGLVQLGFDRALLAVFNEDGNGNKQASMLLSPDGKDANLVKPVLFDPGKLVPDMVDRRWREKSWVLKPLVFQSEALGYLMLPVDKSDQAVYDTISKQLATTLKGALLLQQIRSHEKSLEEIVNRRTTELIETNKLLTGEIDTRIRLEQEVIEISNQTMDRIGQDLHDDLCQHLAGISMLSTAVRNSLAMGNPADISAIDRINALLVDAIDRAKRIVRGMISTEVKQQGLSVSLDALVEAARKSYNVDIAFSDELEDGFFSDEQALQVYRIIQEALMNSIKHSGCTGIFIHLYNSREKNRHGNIQDFIISEICDNGSGMELENTEKGMGLKIMKYRAEKANARLFIEKLAPGTRVICKIGRQGG